MGRLAVVLLAMGWAVASATAQERIALTIGNSAYRSMPPLSTPARDAEAVGAMLKEIGFGRVDVYRDLGAGEMRRVLADLAKRCAGAETVVIYYAGLAVEGDGSSYLVPVDADSTRDVDPRDAALSVTRLLEECKAVSRLRVVLLDTARADLPVGMAQSRDASSRERLGSTAAGPGGPDTLIAFATGLGSARVETGDPNGAFTAALLTHLRTRGLDLRTMLGRVRDEVLRRTKFRQQPFVIGRLGSGPILLVP
ncbi:caspase domain-containing protein [Rhodoplanes sp. SY1]|uniref:caspase family protein n=1 Tax=Rhodoplanes sp. SY1 TaxID=3166646 RepID=UPI0038B60DDD